MLLDIVVIKEFVFCYLSIDKQSSDVIKIDEIFENKSIFIYKEFIEIDSQFVNNVAKLSIIFVDALTIRDLQVLKLNVNSY